MQACLQTAFSSLLTGLLEHPDTGWRLLLRWPWVTLLFFASVKLWNGYVDLLKIGEWLTVVNRWHLNLGRIISLSFRRPGPAQIKNITINQTRFRHQRLPATHGTFTVARLISLHTLHCLNHARIMSPSRRSHLSEGLKLLTKQKKGVSDAVDSSTTEHSYRGKNSWMRDDSMFPNRRNTGNICSISVCSRPTRKLLYTDKLVEENAK